MRGQRKSANDDHRIRVARERRERTHRHIIESALRVFAEKGPDAPVIDDFIKAAGIARGTFYNYYKSTHALLETVSHAMEDSAIASIESDLAGRTDPLDRLATGVLLWLRMAASDPLWCSFVVRVRRRGAAVERQLAADLRHGIRDSVLSIASVPVGRDLVVGTILEAMNRMASGRVPKAYPTAVARAILHGLGVDRRRVEGCLRRGRARTGTRPTRTCSESAISRKR
jgi:AcrR family transcriptional regulator